jgi:hypothetical protein
MDIDRNTYQDKERILAHLRYRAAESYAELITIYGEQEFRKRAKHVNTAIKNSTESVKSIIIQKSIRNGWSQEEVLNNILMLSYCSYVVMIEFRNKAWKYDYMAFARRIGELWEPFCMQCFNYPVNDEIELYEPPLFADVKGLLQGEIRDFISALEIGASEKAQLLSYYDKVWSLVTSGEIKLELDLHFKKADRFYNVDFKSGFQSNEKGNTNRLLLVASIYHNILKDNHKCKLFVRADEDDNNNYLQTLKHSGLWDVSCGAETYEKIGHYSGFDLSAWISNNMNWGEDIDNATMDHLGEKDLVKYLSW